MLNNEKKYLLLLSAKLGGHKIDCVSLCVCHPNNLTEIENDYIEFCSPCLNILTPYGKQDISKLKIEDVLGEKDTMVAIEGKWLHNFNIREGLPIGRTYKYKSSSQEEKNNG